MASMTPIEQSIHAELDLIEATHDVRIVLAIESGSRAWGFASRDSDYDVRFVYVHRPDWYVAVFPGRDVIERPVDEVLDINGWDLRKALELMRKSNPTLLEWLSSPIVYRALPAVADALRTLGAETFQPIAACHHYLSMARLDRIRSGSETDVRLKRYLYAMRATLAARWVGTRLTAPPMLFSELVEAFLPSGPIRAHVDELLAIKADSAEVDTIPRRPELDDVLGEWADAITANVPAPAETPGKERFNAALRSMLAAGWLDDGKARPS